MMRQTYFIADIHLQMNNPQQQQLFTAFAAKVASDKADLYIIGDLFDYWANNNIIYRNTRWVFDCLQSLTVQGLKVGILFGNRDFLLRKKMVEHYGISYLGEEAVITACGKRIFLAHGHTLCLHDTRFLDYKAHMWPWFRLLDSILPGILENYIAGIFIDQSKKVIEAQDPSRFVYTKTAIQKLFNDGIDYVVCGHTHKPETFRSGSHIFQVLPSWEDSTGFYLACTKDEVILLEYRPA